MPVSASNACCVRLRFEKRSNMATMTYYFTKDKERVPKDSKDREVADAGLVLTFDMTGKGVVTITFTKEGKDRPTSTSSADATGVAIGPSSGGGIGIQWLPGYTKVTDNEADDWHLEGRKIKGGGTQQPGPDKDIALLDPPVPDGANDAHGALKKKDNK